MDGILFQIYVLPSHLTGGDESEQGSDGDSEHTIETQEDDSEHETEEASEDSEESEVSEESEDEMETEGKHSML